MFTFEKIASHIEKKANLPYSDPLEHLSDLIKRQELLVTRALSQFRRNFNQSKDGHQQ